VWLPQLPEDAFKRTDDAAARGVPPDATARHAHRQLGHCRRDAALFPPGSEILDLMSSWGEPLLRKTLR